MYTLSLVNLLTAGVLLARSTFALPQNVAPPNPASSGGPLLDETANDFQKRDGKHITSSADDCKLDFADEWSAGRSRGAPFCASQVKNGLFVKGFFIYSGSAKGPGPFGVPVDFFIISGMTVLYSNGDYTNIGSQTGTKNYVEWDVSKASVTKINLNPPSLEKDVRLTDIRIVGPNGRAMGGFEAILERAGEKNVWSDNTWDTKYKTPIHGPIVGVAGKTGTYGIETITFYTLNAKAKKSVIHDVKFSPSLEELNGRSGNE